MARESLNRIVVLYGSQTGTAEDVSSSIARMALERGFPDVLVSDLNSYEKSQLVEEKLVIFVVATTGDGEEPDNMKSFWSFLLDRRLSVGSPLDGLLFGVFGLGDSSYAKYNYVGKRLYRRLKQLGAVPIVERGDGDDQHPQGIDGSLRPWLKDLWFNVYRHFECSHLVKIKLGPKYELLPWNEGEIASDKSMPMKLITNERITGVDHFQDVRRICLASPFPLETCKPGDIAMVRGKCLKEDVDDLIERMGWKDVKDKVFKIKRNRPDASSDLDGRILPFHEILSDLLDIWSPPQRSFVEWISQFVVDDAQQEEKLKDYISSPDGYEDWVNYCIRVKRTVPEILRDFDHVKIPFEYIFDVFGRNKARSFSISSISNDKKTMELTVAIVQYQTRIRTPRQGFLTRWIKDVEDGSIIDVSLKAGTMNIPFDRPLILVAAGTGIAPFRYFLQQRRNNVRCGGKQQVWLFYGFRDRNQDGHYISEFQQECLVDGTFHLELAPSRETSKKCYVQDRMTDPAISPYLHQMLFDYDAAVFIAGNTKLPDAIFEAIKVILNRHEPNVHDPNVISAWKREGKIQWESW